MISDDLPELLATCHRILVMKEGRITADLAGPRHQPGRPRAPARLMRLDLTRNETLVAAVIVAFCAVAAIVDPGFLSMPTLTDLLRGGIVLGIFAVGAMLVLVSGGIDVSFTAVAAFAMYTTTLLLVSRAPGLPWPAAFLIAMAIGARWGPSTGSSSPASGCRR